jgi:hypothetical protein
VLAAAGVENAGCHVMVARPWKAYHEIGIRQIELTAVALHGAPRRRNSRHPPRIRRMSPLRLTDSQITSIFAAARPLAVQDRDPFLQEVATALAGISDPGDGDVARAIRAVQRKHFDPPQFDERSEPHRRMAKAR